MSFRSNRKRNKRYAPYARVGNWCGPGWTAGQAKDAKDITPQDRNVPALSAIDKVCKEHDIDIADATTDEDLYEADKQFIQNAPKTGIQGIIMAQMVRFRGPSAHLSINQDMDKARGHKRFRSEVDEHSTALVVSPTGEFLPPSTTENTMAVSGGKGRTEGAETAVDPWINYKLRPFYQTQNCLMPYIANTNLSIGAGVGAASVGSFSFRLNSIYDIITTSTYTADPTPTSDTADASVNLPSLWTYWSSIYRYWTVVKTEWTVQLFHNQYANTSDQELSVFCYYNGQQQPPLLNNDGVSNVPDYVRNMHKHVRMEKLYPHSNSEGSIARGGIILKGTYEPGKSVHNDVAEDEFAETWHKTNEVSSQREVCTIIVQRSDYQRNWDTSTLVNVRLKLYITYYVQWKDLVVAYQYPVLDTDYPAVTDPNAKSN